MQASNLENYLSTLSQNEWLEKLGAHLPSVHAVDKNAVQIWFSFYPLELYRFLQKAEDKAKAIHQLGLNGEFSLENQIDSSHRFLYGHRFWNETKQSILSRMKSLDTDKTDFDEEVKVLAKAVAMSAGVSESLVTGIVLVGLMTLVQVGTEKFAKAAETVGSLKFSKLSPEHVLENRNKPESQGLLGFLRTVDKQFTVTFDESTADGKFKAFLKEEITTAAQRFGKKTDARCIEGPIPVECKSAACGSCWVGVIAGAEHISEETPREEKQKRVFGYRTAENAKPIIRLACQSKIEGGVTIVIPPWNGVIGRKIYDDIEFDILEGATTSARKNRTIVANAVKNELL